MEYEFASELKKLREEALRDKSDFFPIFDFTVDDAVVRFMGAVLPRTALAAYAPRPGERFRRWVVSRSFPQVLTHYVHSLHGEMMAARREALRAREEEEKARRTKEEQERVRENRARARNLLDTENTLVRRFCEIALRKVRMRDEYGDENWDALPGEIKLVSDKLLKKRPDASDARTEIIRLLEEEFRAYYRARLENDEDDESVAEMTGVEFEAHLMARLEALGARDVCGTAKSGDQGGDILFRYGSPRIVVQCKRHKRPVGNKAIQEAHAAKTFYGCDRAWVITNSTFTGAARQLASSVGVTLIERADLPRLREFLERLA